MSEPRNPLAALRRKAEKGQDVTVAFFGGSITWGGNSSDIETRSYRALAGDWFRRRLKGVKVRCVNGGYGGTGSVAGAYRFEEHALEFGTMSKTDHELTIACREGFLLPQVLQLEGKKALDARAFSNGLHASRVMLGNAART